MKKSLGVTLGALLLASGVVYAAGGAGWGGCEGGGERFGKHDRGGDPARMIEHLDRELSLTDEQRQQITTLMAERGDMRGSMRAFRDEHHALNPASPDYVEQVAELATEQSKVMAKQMVERARIHAEMYAILTPEQQQRFGEMRAKRGEKHRGMGLH